MGKILLACPKCGGTDLHRNGRSESNKQRYLCKNTVCDVVTFTLEPHPHRGRRPEVREAIIRMASNGSGMRDIARTLKVSRTTVTSLLKKVKRDSSSKSKHR